MLFSRLSHGRTRGSIGWRSADPIENRTVSSVPVFLSPQDLRPKPKVLDRRHWKTTFSETIGDTTTLPYDVPIAMLSTVQSDQFFADRVESGSRVALFTFQPLNLRLRILEHLGAGRCGIRSVISGEFRQTASHFGDGFNRPLVCCEGVLELGPLLVYEYVEIALHASMIALCVALKVHRSRTATPGPWSKHHYRKLDREVRFW